MCRGIQNRKRGCCYTIPDLSILAEKMKDQQGSKVVLKEGCATQLTLCHCLTKKKKKNSTINESNRDSPLAAFSAAAAAGILKNVK